MSLPDDPAIRARLLRHAMLRPEAFLAAALAEIPDEDLAAAIGADHAKVWRLRICGYPKAAQWTVDVQRMAALVGGDATLLERLLAEVGVRP
jgi:hypothetical protein